MEYRGERYRATDARKSQLRAPDSSRKIVRYTCRQKHTGARVTSSLSFAAALAQREHERLTLSCDVTSRVLCAQNCSNVLCWYREGGRGRTWRCIRELMGNDGAWKGVRSKVSMELVGDYVLRVLGLSKEWGCNVLWESLLLCLREKKNTVSSFFKPLEMEFFWACDFDVGIAYRLSKCQDVEEYLVFSFFDLYSSEGRIYFVYIAMNSKFGM